MASEHEVLFVRGPAHGCRLPARCPDGVVLSNKPAGAVALYDRVGAEMRFREIRDRRADRLLDAQESAGWDVLAWSESMGTWPA